MRAESGFLGRVASVPHSGLQDSVVLSKFDGGSTAAEIARDHGLSSGEVVTRLVESGRLNAAYLERTGGPNRTSMHIEDVREWSACRVVESVSGRMGGMPVLLHTRMPADWVIGNFDSGMTADELAEDFDLDVDHVREVLMFARRQVQPASS